MKVVAFLIFLLMATVQAVWHNRRIFLFLLLICCLVNAHTVYQLWAHPELTESNDDNKFYWYLQDIGIFSVPGILAILHFNPPQNKNFRFACLTIGISYTLDVLQRVIGFNFWGWHLEVIAIFVANIGYWVSTEKE